VSRRSSRRFSGDEVEPERVRTSNSTSTGSCQCAPDPRCGGNGMRARCRNVQGTDARPDSRAAVGAGFAPRHGPWGKKNGHRAADASRNTAVPAEAGHFLPGRENGILRVTARIFPRRAFRTRGPDQRGRASPVKIPPLVRASSTSGRSPSQLNPRRATSGPSGCSDGLQVSQARRTLAKTGSLPERGSGSIQAADGTRGRRHVGLRSWAMDHLQRGTGQRGYYAE